MIQKYSRLFALTIFLFLSVVHLSKVELKFIDFSNEFYFENSPEANKFIEDILNDNTKDVPNEVDWRKEGRVTRVQNTRNNHFTMTGLIEGQMANLNKTMIELSVQQLIDCLENDRFFVNKLNELGKFGGIESAEWYPFIDDLNYRCFYDKTKSVMSIKGGAMLPSGDENSLKKIVAKYGPVAAGFDTTPGKFYYYRKGVYNETNCRKDLPKTYLLIVGYGTDQIGGDYWLARNNYGVQWGEGGYIKIARGKNLCGIESFATIVTL